MSTAKRLREAAAERDALRADVVALETKLAISAAGFAKMQANEAKLREALKEASDAFRFEGDHGTADRYYQILEETKP